MRFSFGVGSMRDSTTKGALCGRGDISIESTSPGEEEGGGGVRAVSDLRFSNGFVHVPIILPRPLNLPNKFVDEKRARRGVAS